jgi:hypothetical protein
MKSEIETYSQTFDRSVYDGLRQELGPAFPREIFYLCLLLKVDRDALADSEDQEGMRVIRGTFRRLDESVYTRYQNDLAQLSTMRTALANTVNGLLLKDLYACEWPATDSRFDPGIHDAEKDAGNTIAVAKTAILKNVRDGVVINKALVITKA